LLEAHSVAVDVGAFAGDDEAEVFRGGTVAEVFAEILDEAAQVDVGPLEAEIAGFDVT
jgi:hypothetical protein